jgi:hypothetical protein
MTIAAAAAVPAAGPHVASAGTRPAALAMRGAGWERLAPLWLGLIAAGYYAIGCRLSLEWFDEGQIVYPSWRVAEGAIPYREFGQLYGPSVFYLNALLFRVFGADVLVLRVELVILKAVAAVLVYLAARRMAAPPFALAVYGLMLVVWGAPWWIFNTPYANHYALTLSLAGLLIFLSSSGWRGAAVAGICFGLATTFKQTAGIFVVLALIAFVSWEASAPGRSPDASPPSSFLDRHARLIRVGALLGALAVVVISLAARNTAWNTVVLFGPLGLSLLWVGWRDVRFGARSLRPGVLQLVAASIGMALPLIAYGVSYARLGLLAPLVFNTLVGLPQAVHWLDPVPLPDKRAILLTLVLCGSLAAARWWAMSAPSHDWRRRAAWVALAVAVAAALAFTAPILRSGGMLRYLRDGAWIGDVFRFVFILPWLVLAGSLHAIFLAQHTPGADATTRWSVLRSAALFHFFAAANLLVLYPAGDFPHLVMVLPAFLPSLAFQLERFSRAAPAAHGAGWRTRAPSLAVAVVLCLCAAPFVHALVTARANRPVDGPFARASGIVDSTAKFRDGRALVDYLKGLPPDASMVVIGEGQMLHFLASRRSAFEPHEYVFYLVNVGWMEAADARALAPEQRLVAQLEASKPIVVVSSEGPFAERFRGVFQAVASYIDGHYEVIETIGPYRVMMWRAT